jgi:PKD repeat protein
VRPRPSPLRLALAVLAAFAVMAAVAPADITKSAGTTFDATAGQEFNGRVATFTSDLKEVGSDAYSAEIRWGDGTSPTAGQVVVVAGGITTDFEVRGKHTYANGGKCTVTVVIRGNPGFDDDVREVQSTANVSGTPGPPCGSSSGPQQPPPPVQQPPEPPTVAMTLPEHKGPGNPVVFKSKSKGGSSSIGSWQWDFGDGQSAAGTRPTGNATHIYEEPGKYTVTLTVTDLNGLSATATGEITIQEPPKAVITFVPKKPFPNTMVQLKGNMSTPTGHIVRYQWVCKGEKTKEVDSTGKPPDKKHFAQCQFGTAKQYSAKLTVTSDTGEKATTAIYLPIKPKRPPLAALSFAPDQPEQDQTITFDASGSKSDPKGEGGGITTYRWEFADGTDEETTTPKFKHSFKDIGIKQLSLTVRDKEGKTTIKDAVYVGGKCLGEVTVRGVTARSDCLRKMGMCGKKLFSTCYRGLPGDVVKLNGVDLRPPAQEGIQLFDSGRVDAGVEGSSFDVMFGSFKIATRGSFTIPGGGGAKTPDGDWAIDSGSLHGFSFATDPLLFRPDGTSSIGLNLKLPAPLDSVSGRAELAASNDSDGPYLGAVHAEAHDIPFPPFYLNSVVFDYSETNDSWFGSISVDSPSGTFGGEVGFLGGSLNHLGLSGDNLNYALGNGVFLQRIAGSYTHDTRTITADVGVTAGPELNIPGAGAGSLIRIDGSFLVSFPPGGGWSTALSGEGRVVGVPVGTAGASLDSSGRFKANVVFDTTLYAVFDVHAIFDLIYYSHDFFQAAAGIDICTRYIVHECAGGEIVLSSVGIAACIRLPSWAPDVGGYYKWGADGPHFYFAGCSVGPVSIQIARIRPSQSRTFTVRKGTSAEVLAFEGQDGPPNVILNGPKGQHMETPADGYDMTKPYFVSQEPQDKKTYVIVSQPAAGKWTVSVADGSTPIVRMERAQGLPDPQIKAKVTGSGLKRRLEWTATPIQGQRITFSEQGAKSGDVIGTTTKARGSFAFTPADGPKGKRTIVAEVLQGGNPRKVLKVASYTTPRVAPGRPGKLKLRRKGTSLVASWGRAAGATGYDVQVTLSDGRRIPILTAKRSVTIPGFAKTETATVSVAGYRVAGLLGPAVKASVKPPKTRKPK